MLGIYRISAQLVASRVVLSSTELVGYPRTVRRYFEIFFHILTNGPVLREWYILFWSFTGNIKEDEKQRYSEGSKQKALPLLCIRERGKHKGYYIMKLSHSVVSLLPSRYHCMQRKHRAHTRTCCIPSLVRVPMSCLQSSLYSYKRFVFRKRFFLFPCLFKSFVPYIFYHVVSVVIEYVLSLLLIDTAMPQLWLLLDTRIEGVEFRPSPLC
jgi:hypothetical protein